DLHYLRYAIDILFKNQYVWWNYFPAIRYRDEWKDPANFIENPKSTKPFDFVHNAKGFAPLENIIRDQTYAEMPREGYIPPPANYLQSMRKILDLSREHGFELMVFDTIWYGFTNPVFDLYDPGAVYDLMEKEGLDYVDFREAPIAYDWKQIHLYDVDHPSTFGSLIISLRMAEYLAQKYDLPLDGEKMEYYQTYFFNEHVIERNGRGLTIRLVPADVSAPLLYAWEVTHDGRVVETSDFGADPTFSFNMSSSGDYLIRVQVWNPNGDYVLPAVFTYTLN
ncbi:MAG: hypothetical protein JW750_05970, partial [Anaerolineaceae bacterium]|nr:hypothetical protein [Anaerolineaceae bacterium]